MTVDAAGEIETVRERLEAGERGGSDADRERLLEFSDRLQLLAEEYSDDRHIKLLRHLMRVSEEVDADVQDGILTDALYDREVAEEAVRWINRHYDNPETNRDYRVSLRVFGKRVAHQYGVECDDDDYPVTLAWISSNTPRSYDPSPNPAEILSWDEADAMTDAARNSRDAAMVQLLMDAGPRGGEFYDLEVGDVTDSEQGLQVFVDGKTGERSVTLIPSVPYVNRWLDDHPGDDDDYLWSGIDDPTRVSRGRVYQILRRLAEKAEVTKTVTPTAFRKANATWLAETGANGPLIARRQGRRVGSKAVARYIAQFGKDSEASAYAQLHGRDIDTDEPERRDSVECPRCDKPNPPTKDQCMWCGQGLDPSGAEKTANTNRRIQAALADLPRESAMTVLQAVDIVDENPGLRAVLHAAVEQD